MKKICFVVAFFLLGAIDSSATDIYDALLNAESIYNKNELRKILSKDIICFDDSILFEIKLELSREYLVMTLAKAITQLYDDPDNLKRILFVVERISRKNSSMFFENEQLFDAILSLFNHRNFEVFSRILEVFSLVLKNNEHTYEEPFKRFAASIFRALLDNTKIKRCLVAMRALERIIPLPISQSRPEWQPAGLVKLIGTFLKKPDYLIVNHALSCLFYLSMNKKNAEQIFELMPELISLLKSTYMKTAQNAFSCLNSIFTLHEIEDEIKAEPRTILLATLLREFEEEVDDSTSKYIFVAAMCSLDIRENEKHLILATNFFQIATDLIFENQMKFQDVAIIVITRQVSWGDNIYIVAKKDIVNLIMGLICESSINIYDYQFVNEMLDCMDEILRTDWHGMLQIENNFTALGAQEHILEVANRMNTQDELYTKFINFILYLDQRCCDPMLKLSNDLSMLNLNSEWRECMHVIACKVMESPDNKYVERLWLINNLPLFKELRLRMGVLLLMAYVQDRRSSLGSGVLVMEPTSGVEPLTY